MGDTQAKKVTKLLGRLKAHLPYYEKAFAALHDGLLVFHVIFYSLLVGGLLSNLLMLNTQQERISLLNGWVAGSWILVIVLKGFLDAETSRVSDLVKKLKTNRAILESYETRLTVKEGTPLPDDAQLSTLRSNILNGLKQVNSYANFTTDHLLEMTFKSY